MIGIYKITNQINGKIYIGQSIDIKNRWKQHIGEAKQGRYNTRLYNALRKYNIDNFTFEVIEECKSTELNEREIYWIEYYQSYVPAIGYNMNTGGLNFFKIKPEIIYYLWDSGKSVGEIAEELKDKIAKSTIRKYLYSYPNYSKEESKRREGMLKALKYNNSFDRDDLQNKVIKQYDIFGNFIKDWNTIRQVERELDICHTSISNALQGKTLQAHGYQWKRGDKNDLSSINSIIDKVPLHFKIIQKDKNGNIVGYYNTAKEAGEAMGISPSNILRVCQHKNNRKTAKGYIWEYDFNSWYDPN